MSKVVEFVGKVQWDFEQNSSSGSVSPPMNLFKATTTAVPTTRSEISILGSVLKGTRSNYTLRLICPWNEMIAVAKTFQINEDGQKATPVLTRACEEQHMHTDGTCNSPLTLGFNLGFVFAPLLGFFPQTSNFFFVKRGLWKQGRSVMERWNIPRTLGRRLPYFNQSFVVPRIAMK